MITSIATRTSINGSILNYARLTILNALSGFLITHALINNLG